MVAIWWRHTKNRPMAIPNFYLYLLCRYICIWICICFCICIWVRLFVFLFFICILELYFFCMCICIPHHHEHQWRQYKCLWSDLASQSPSTLTTVQPLCLLLQILHKHYTSINRQTLHKHKRKKHIWAQSNHSVFFCK